MNSLNIWSVRIERASQLNFNFVFGGRTDRIQPRTRLSALETRLSRRLA
jgi:hypothetical protein